MTASHLHSPTYLHLFKNTSPNQIINHPFSKKVCNLAKKIIKISESNANNQIKNLRIDILNKLEFLIETLRDAMMQYQTLSFSKPNYREYHEPILKLGKTCQLYFKKNNVYF